MTMKNQIATQRENLASGAKQTLELVAFLAHEFKSQLTLINTSASLLAEKAAAFQNEPEAKLIDKILDANHCLEVKTSELLSLVNLQIDGFNLELELTDIDALVHKVANQLAPIISNREQSLILNMTPNIKKIVADSLRVEQVLHNLLLNASKYTPTGGNISVSTAKQEGYIVIAIQDGSKWIPSLEQRDLLQPYCRFTDDNDTQITGTGLGLAISKHLVELHGGTMWIENKKNNGRIFAFSLPLKHS